MVLKFAAGTLLCMAAVSALGTESPRLVQDNRQDWGISVGAYFPVDEDIRDQFGDALLRLGFSPTSRKFKKSVEITTDVNILYAKEDDSKLFLLPVTVGVRYNVGSEDRVDGYVSVNAGPAYMDYRLFRNSVSYRDSKIGWNANVEVGALLGRKLAITGRYDLYSKSDGFDFSGFSVSVNLALFRW